MCYRGQERESAYVAVCIYEKSGTYSDGTWLGDNGLHVNAVDQWLSHDSRDNRAVVESVYIVPD
jgi:hypothetical protein